MSTSEDPESYIAVDRTGREVLVASKDRVAEFVEREPMEYRMVSRSEYEPLGDFVPK